MGVENKKNSQPAIFYRISDFLKKSEMKYKIFDIRPEYSSEKISSVIGTELSQEVKTLVVVGDEKDFFLVAIARLKNVDLSVLKEELNLKNIRMATSEEVKKNTNTEVGSVSPFGNLVGLPLYVDYELTQQKEIAFGSGLHTKIIVMPFEDFRTITNPIIGRYTRN